MTLSAEVKRKIALKSEELYEKRIAPYAKDLSSLQKEAILAFQKLVFTVDYYFEHNKEINQNILSYFWKQAEKFFDDLGINKSTQLSLLQDIRDYADIEMSTREGKKLSEYEIKLFYFKKSCDVRMQRHIIRYLNQQPDVSSEDEIIRDILEEIEDDVDDIEEDRATPFNGNRFLEILNSQDGTRVQEYIIFINSQYNAPPDLAQRIIGKINNVTSKY